MTSLFDSNPHSRFRNLSNPNYLLEFKAGRCIRDGETDWDDDDGMAKFCWKPLGSSEAEESWIVFPGDIVFRKVKESSGRVYVLKFFSSPERQFFWMQEPDEKKDRSIAATVSKLINGSEMDFEMEEVHDTPLSNTFSDPNNFSGSNSGLNSAINNHNEHSAVAQEAHTNLNSTLSTAFVGGVPSNMASSSSSHIIHDDISSSLASTKPDLQDLKSIIENIRVPQTYKDSPLKLSNVISPDVLLPLLNDPDFCNVLFPQLPEGVPKTKEELENTIRSPQFENSIQSLSFALESGQMAPLAQSLGLHPDSLSSVESFLNALKEKIHRENQ
ncbi:26S proteasome regulatory subunit RPN13 [Smittium mucronatum]|uniref:26S proteasome regulatory subunit RPN13 n=1 Tax=Smittium mucronatum TaxID=133383 RepID=A0A1R0GTK1_9FUNG|nr:26S proteasome regulatory subunit RPN13 [Smittium mucronatum]